MRSPIYFMRGLQRFEIVKDVTASECRWIGYLDGSPSVVAPEAFLAARALIEKYITKTRQRISEIR